MKEGSSVLVSIIMITYGHEAYIKEAILGVLNQQCDFKYELIISNDNSPDNTDLVVREIIAEHPLGSFIRYIKHDKNIGMMPNFIFSVMQGKAKYIALCEGDDYWTDPLKLQKQIAFLEANIEYSGCAHQSMVSSNTEELRIFNQDVPSDILVKNLIGKRLFHTASIVFKRSALDLFVNAPKVFSGDRLLFFCIASLGKIRFFNESMCVYRLHNSGASSTANIDQISLDLNSIPYIKKLCRDFPVNQYKSYVYATIGLCRNGPFIKRMYYVLLSFLFSFSNFPDNILDIFNYVRRRV